MDSVYIIEEKETYRHSYAMPIGYVSSLKGLANFLKREGYYIRSHAQSANAIAKEINRHGHCTFYWDTGKHFKPHAGLFKKIYCLDNITGDHR